MSDNSLYPLLTQQTSTHTLKMYDLVYIKVYRQLKTYAESKAGKLSCEVSQKQYYSR